MAQKFKLAIIGSREFRYYNILVEIINPIKDKISEIVSGGAYGADKLAERYAKENNIPVTIFLPDWDTYGKSAGFKRNSLIIEHSDCVIAFWDGESRGTLDSINKAKKLKKPLRIIKYDNTKKQS